MRLFIYLTVTFCCYSLYSCDDNYYKWNKAHLEKNKTCLAKNMARLSRRWNLHLCGTVFQVLLTFDSSVFKSKKLFTTRVIFFYHSFLLHHYTVGCDLLEMILPNSKSSARKNNTWSRKTPSVVWFGFPVQRNLPQHTTMSCACLLADHSLNQLKNVFIMLVVFYCYWCSDKESFAATMAAITPCIHCSLRAWNQSWWQRTDGQWRQNSCS